MIKRLSERLSSYIVKHSEVSYEPEAIAYGLEIILGVSIKLTIILSISNLFGVFLETLVILWFSAMLRVISGGVHCTSYGRCLITSLLVFISLGLVGARLVELIDCTIMFYILICSVFILTLIWYLWIPTGCENKPLTKTSARKKYRKLSLAFLGVYYTGCFVFLKFFPVSEVLRFVVLSNVGLLWQGFTLTPLGFASIDQLDQILKF